MKIIHFIKTSIVLAAFSVLSLSTPFLGSVNAQTVCTPPGGMGPPSAAQCENDGSTPVNNSTAPTGSAKGGTTELNKLLKNAINGLSAIALLVFVVSLIAAGFQYMTARDNASAVAAAKDRIVTVVITFILFVFGFGILQWLVPGGIFN